MVLLPWGLQKFTAGEKKLDQGDYSGIIASRPSATARLGSSRKWYLFTSYSKRLANRLLILGVALRSIGRARDATQAASCVMAECAGLQPDDGGKPESPNGDWLVALSWLLSATC